jgi:hypothetical protein
MAYVTADDEGGGSAVYQCTNGCSKVNLHVCVDFLFHIYVVYVPLSINFENISNTKSEHVTKTTFSFWASCTKEV